MKCFPGLWALSHENYFKACRKRHRNASNYWVPRFMSWLREQGPTLNCENCKSSRQKTPEPKSKPFRPSYTAHFTKIIISEEARTPLRYPSSTTRVPSFRTQLSLEGSKEAPCSSITYTSGMGEVSASQTGKLALLGNGKEQNNHKGIDSSGPQ